MAEMIEHGKVFGVSVRSSGTTVQLAVQGPAYAILDELPVRPLIRINGNELWYELPYGPELDALITQTIDALAALRDAIPGVVQVEMELFEVCR